MARKTFQFIKDTRFSNTPRSDIKKMTEQLEREIFDKAILIVYPIREIHFPDEITSYRRKFIIERRKGFTWNDLYSVINKIQAPVYKNI